MPSTAFVATAGLAGATGAFLYQKRDLLHTFTTSAPTEVKLAGAAFCVSAVCLIIQAANRLLYGNVDPLGRSARFLRSYKKNDDAAVDSAIDEYNALQNDDSTTQESRNDSYATLVDHYYSLATTFYEWGWGTSFHFAYKLPAESFDQSIKRHEYFLAGKLGAHKGQKLLDCGCGIGGPMRNIAEFTQCDITGITINQHQVDRGNELTAARGLGEQCRSVRGDFMKMPFEDNTFDGVYAIEATCHAPCRQDVYREIFRVLKPGQIFACYEWCLTPEYDANNADHRFIKKAIEEGDGLPDMIRTHVVDEAIEEVGFEILESRDKALTKLPEGSEPWYLPLTPNYNIFSQRFQFTEIGMAITRNMLWVMEKLRLAPKGTCKVQAMLQQGGIGCGRGGTTGVFTPMYFVCARKPLDANE